MVSTACLFCLFLFRHRRDFTSYNASSRKDSAAGFFKNTIYFTKYYWDISVRFFYENLYYYYEYGRHEASITGQTTRHT